MSNPDHPPALSLEEFRHWLNDRRMMDVSMAFGDIVERYREATEAAAMAATVPAGWKLVPEESTPEMEEAGFNHVYAPTTTNDCAYVWSAMIKAAPQAPVAGQPAEPSPADEPLITVESSLRFNLQCAREKVEALEHENRELRGRLPHKDLAFMFGDAAPKGDSNG